MVRVRRRLAQGTRLAGRIVLRAVLVLSVLFLLALAVGPRTGAYRTVSVLSGSMHPTMPRGSLLVLAPVEPADLSVGDVITFEAPTAERQVVTHRIIELVETGDHPAIRTQGDANSSADPWVARISAGPAWRSVMVVPAAGGVIRLMRAPLFQTLTLYLVPALIFVWMLSSIWSRPPPLHMARPA